MIIAVDFDGTIVEHAYPKIGKLKPGAKKIINKWYDKGDEIIIWTCRYLPKDLSSIKLFLMINKINYHKINENADSLIWNPFPKVYYDVLIDDRIIGGLPSWDKVDILLEELHKEGIYSGKN